jgi:antitoxin ParD1/3/4
MPTINVTLPDATKAYVDEQIARGGYTSESDYVLALIHDAQKRETRQRFEAQLLQGMQSPRTPMTAADWLELRQQVLERSPELKNP